MPSLTIDLPLPLLHAITADAMANGHDFNDVVVSALQASFGQTAAPPVMYDDEVAKAVDRCRALPKSTQFSLNADYTGSRRLFSREEWRAMTSNAAFRPTVFGRQFSKAILATGLAAPKTKTSDNKQIYERL